MEDKMLWPGGKRAAAMISIELDAELIWMELDPTNIDRPKTLSMGTYGMRRGIFRLLEALDERNLKATFFVPGKLTETYGDVIKQISLQGHEIALHGYAHENFGLLSKKEQKNAILNGVEALETLLGKRPEGFRLPEGNMSPWTLELISEMGFLYDSSMVDGDLPYILSYGKRKMVEIPMCWELQDFPYFAFNFVPPFPEGESRIAPYSSVLDIWKRELEAYYTYGLCYVIKFDPQIIGTPGRLPLFEEILDNLMAKDFWIAKGREIAIYHNQKQAKEGE